MPSYPAIDPTKGSWFEPRDGRVEDFAGDGTVRIRKLHADKGTFHLRHELNPTSRATLKSFCDTNATTSFDFVWVEDGLTYQVRIGKGGLKIKPGEAELREAEIDLVIVS